MTGPTLHITVCKNYAVLRLHLTEPYPKVNGNSWSFRATWHREGYLKGSCKNNSKSKKTGESSSDWTLCLLVVLLLCVFLSLMHDMKTLALSLEVEGESWTVCEGICWGPPCRFQKRGSSMSFSRVSPRQDERNERNANRECQAHPAPGCWDYLKGVSWCCCQWCLWWMWWLKYMKTDCDNLIFSRSPP